ncbi:MAG: ribonuclease R [Prevotellaceae bacterium]|jgi:ribonuclease R|nr:ribonuclease R [Prevotellaceae bacterium]
MSKKKEKKLTPVVKDLLQGILNIFLLNPNKSYNYRQIASQFGIIEKDVRTSIVTALEEFEKQGILQLVDKSKYCLKQEDKFLVGTIDLTKQGNGYLIPEEEEEDDIFIAQHNLMQALHGDKVKIRVFNKRSGRAEGEVVEIIEQSSRMFVGKIELTESYGFVITDSRNMPYDIFIPHDKLLGVKNGQKAVAKITEWKKGMRNPVGEVTDVLGDVGNNDVEMHAILAEFNLPYSFPKSVDAVAKKISEKITAADRSSHRDFRDVPTFTIDPVDAKDFDDALSFRKLDNGNFEVGVHISDVTHYVMPDTAIDREAVKRATSIYLVDRTIPMLPERLSNYICSLRPDEEKLCFSVVFELDKRANVVGEWFGRTVIKSRRRFTYEEAQEVIETGEGEYKHEILKLNELAQLMRAKRFKAGAVTFEREEPKFEIDENGKPLRVYFKALKESNQLIEEFMLLANKKVAELIGKKRDNRKERTFVYRIHEKPNEDKLGSFKEFIKRFGYMLETSEEKNISKEMNKILEQVKGKPEANLIETLAIRSMAKAKYSTDNVGHYGLAFPYYTHFTSPIRRYPDMMVHRLLAHYLDGGKSVDKNMYETLCKHSSVMEQRVAEAERASIKYKMVEFMQDNIGQEFDGLISGVTEWGIYVELINTKIEGMVSVRAMKDDFYYFDEENYSLVGRSSDKRYMLGDKVRIKVLSTDLQQKHLDFVMINEKTNDFIAAAKGNIKNERRKKSKK